MKLKQKKDLFKKLKTITDFRTHRHKIVYPLEEILFMTLFGLLKGHTTFTDLYFWMKLNGNNNIFKKIFNKAKIRVPSKSTFHNMLVNTNNNELEHIFRDYFKKYTKKENIAVDGKWLNGSDVNGQYRQESHKAIFNVLDKDNKIVIAHKFLEKGKLSEIPAFEELLKPEENIFSGSDKQIFSFDALLTQQDILNTINNNNGRYLAKVKNNQKLLRKKIELTADNFLEPTEIYNKDKKISTIEGNKLTVRVVEIFQSKGCNLVMYHSDFKNIQTIIKVTKITTDIKTNTSKTTVEYLIANFKTTAKDFLDKILQHWRVETYHYHLDMLTKEDDHIAYINPFSISILRSFAINLYQLFFNKNRDKKLIDSSKLIMADIKRYCSHSDKFTSDIYELK